MTDIYVISGFLGAGKTTLIKTLVRTAFRSQKVVVIENDFGEAEIDAKLLEECKLTVTSLSAGCICCSLTGDFEKAVARLMKEYAPDSILVEPSGVGKLSDIVKICLKQEAQGIVHLRKSITVVDVNQFDKYRENYGEFFKDQLRYADLILLSHQTGAGKEIDRVGKKIREINQEARIEADFWDSIPSGVFLMGARNSETFRMEMELAMSPQFRKMEGRERHPGKLEQLRRHFAKEVFTTVTLECREPLSREELERRLSWIVDHADGTILRGKGIVKGSADGLLVHYIPGELKIESTSISGHHICFIGTGLDEEQIKTLFREAP